MRPLPRIFASAAALVLLSLTVSCRDDPLKPIDQSKEELEQAPTPRMLGLIEVTLSGIGTEEVQASAAPVSMDLETAVSGGPQLNLVPLPTGSSGGIQLEQVSSGTFTEGTRSQGGQRYMYATFRIRNASANGVAYPDARTNLTFLAVGTSGTIAGTPISRVNRFDGSAGDPAIAPTVVPTGAVYLDEKQQMRSQFPDVLQVFTEAEVAPGAFATPPAVTNRFPYGFVVRNPKTANSRSLPANPEATQFDGQVTFAFRVPLQPNDPGTSNGVQKDPFTISFVFLAVDDPETRVTESIEEQTPAARTMVAARATALGSSMVTVLDGSPAVDPGVPNYPGQRQICAARTAGTVVTPLTRINAPGAFSQFTILRPGESMHACEPYFRTGSGGRPATYVPFDVMVYATDRYGNKRTMVTDTVRLKTNPGAPSASMPAPQPLVNGEKMFSVTYQDYGLDSLTAVGRRLESKRDILVAGVTRTWGGTVSTDWSAGANWHLGAAPMHLDSVLIPNPSAGPHYPMLVSNVSVRGVTVENGATISLGPFDLTAAASVWSGTSGGITSTSGRLFLTGSEQTVQGVVPRLRVLGRYSLSGNLTARAPLQVDAGSLTTLGFRVQAASF